MIKKLICLGILFSFSGRTMESFDGFLITAYDDRFKVISPDKFKPVMELVIENKTLAKLHGKIVVNKKNIYEFVTVLPDKYGKFILKIKKNDILHFYPLSPAFQEVELIIGNKIYEIPPRK